MSCTGFYSSVAGAVSNWTAIAVLCAKAGRHSVLERDWRIAGVTWQVRSVIGTLVDHTLVLPRVNHVSALRTLNPARRLSMR